MFKAGDYTFTLSVSMQCFQAKPPRSQIRRLVFEPQVLTIDDALSKALDGYAFCYSFKTSNSTGRISLTDKTDANFVSTSTIIYDFDNMDISMEDYVESIPFKPSFAYPTYSNGVHGFRFRLGYVFDKEIWGVQSFNNIYETIATANSFTPETKEHGGWDRRSVAQLYFGTHSASTIYNGNIIYCLGDFPISSYISRNQGVSHTRNQPHDLPQSVPQIGKVFLRDFQNLSYRDFIFRYKGSFQANYFASLKTPLIMDESGMFYRYPQDYVCVYHKRKGKYTLKWEIGDDRKKKMYITAQIMLFNKPSLTIENLLYNLRFERHWYYNNTDNKLTNDYLIQVAKNAYMKPYPLQPSNHPSFSVNKEYWADKGLTANKAKVIISQHIKEQCVLQYYDTSLSIRKNHELLKEKGIRVSRETLSRMVSKWTGQIVKPKSPHTYLSGTDNPDTIRILELIQKDNQITLSKIAQATGLSLITVKRRIKEMKGKQIKRIGNNHSGWWLLIPQLAEPQEDTYDNGWPTNIIIDWGEEFCADPDYAKYAPYLN